MKSVITFLSVCLLILACEQKESLLETSSRTLQLSGSVRFFPLMDDDLIRFSQVSVDPEKNIFVINEDKLFVFDWYGKLEYKIFLEDYFEWQDCYIDDLTWDDRRLLINCKKAQRILVFDRSSGRHLNDIGVDFTITYFTLLKEFLVCFQPANPYVDQSYSYHLLLLDSNYRVQHKILPFEQDQEYVFEETIGPKNIHTNDGSFSFTNVFADSVIFLTADKIMQKLKFNFPRSEIELREDGAEPLILGSDSYLFPLFFSYNEGWESLIYLRGQDPYWAVRNRESNEWFKFSSINYKDINFPPFAKIYGDYCVFMISDEAAISTIPEEEAIYPFDKLINYESSLVIGIGRVSDILDQ